MRTSPWALRRERGFTLIELLVVMIIIGTLAAIAIPVFSSQRAKGRDTAVKANITAIGQSVASYFVDNKVPPLVQIRQMSGLPGFRIAIAPSTGGAWEDAGMLNQNVWSTQAYSGTFPPTPHYVLNTNGWTADAWCIQLFDYVDGTKLYKYSAQKGLGTGFCTSPTTP